MDGTSTTCFFIRVLSDSSHLGIICDHVGKLATSIHGCCTRHCCGVVSCRVSFSCARDLKPIILIIIVLINNIFIINKK